MLIKNIFKYSLLFFVASCSTPNWYKPFGQLVFSQMPKGGSPGYNLGWIHGCQSGLATQFAGAIGMTFYSWSRDVDITSSNPNIAAVKERYGNKELKDVNWNDSADIKRNFSDYNLVFWDAYGFCKQTALGTLRATVGNPPLAGETRYDPSKSNIGDIWKIGGAYDSRIGSTGLW